jgi:hypothetical protein
MGKKIKVDFSGVEKEIKSGGGRSSHVPEDDYLFKVVKGEIRDNKAGDGRHISWRVTVSAGEYKGKTVYHTTSLKPEALWNLRNLIFACLGKNLAGKSVAFDPEILEGKVFAGTTEDDEYDGKMKSVIVDIRPKSDLKRPEDDESEIEDEVDEEEEDEAPAKKKGKKDKAGKKKKAADDDDDLEEVDVEDL